MGVEMTRDEAVAACAQGHRNYAKRQLTWFRKETQMRWLAGFGSAPETESEAEKLVALHVRRT